MKSRLITRGFAVVFVVFLALLGFFTVSGPIDAYHEGAIFPPSVAVADGRIIYEEVNHQYGFLHIYLNAIVMELAGNSLLVYRLTGLMVGLINACLLFMILQRVTSRRNSILFASATLLISPAWSYTDSANLGTVGPWPNTYGITLTLLSIYLFLKVTRDGGSAWWVSISAFAASLSASSRIQFLAVIFFQSLLVLGLAWRHQVSRQIFKYWMSGLVFGFGTIVVALWSQSALDDAFEQLIFVWTLETPNSPHLGPIDFLRSVSLIIFFVTVSLVIWFFSTKVKKAFIGPLLALVGIIILYTTLNFTTLFESLPEEIGRIIKHTLGQVLFSIATVLVATFLVYVFKDALHLIREETKRSPGILDPARFFVSATCLGILFQFHNVNGPYLWMCIHPFIVWFIMRFDSLQVSKWSSHALSSTKSYLLFAISASIALAMIKIDPSRFEHSTPMLKGVYEYEIEKRDFIDSNFSFLRRLDQFGKIRLDCSAGLYSVDDRGYALDSKWTWNEIPFSWRKENIESSIPNHTLVVCSPDDRWTTIYQDLEQRGFLEFIETNGYLTAYRIMKRPVISGH